MKDEKIIELFFERNEQAINELDIKYGSLFFKIAYNILNSTSDAEECVNDAYLGTWNAIPPNKPDPLISFVSKIVRNCSLMRYRANTAKKRNTIYDVALSELEHCLTSGNTTEDMIDEKVLAGIIESFLDTLSKENRVIFMRRYWFSESYGEIANRMGMTEKTVSVRLARIRKRMRSYLIKRGVLL